MISEKSFFHEVRGMLHRRRWPLALCLLTLGLYFGLGVFFAAGAVDPNAMDAAALLASRRGAVSDILGGKSPVPFLVSALSVVLAMQGFAWLHNRREIDFFESQPISRSSRFLAVYLSSALIFVFSYAVSLGIGYLVALGMHCLYPELIVESLYTFFRVLILYLGIFSVTALAMMLTGNVIIALLADGFLLCYEFFFKILLTSYQRIMFPLINSADQLTPPLSSPVYWYLKGLEHYPNESNLFGFSRTLSLSQLTQWISGASASDLAGLLLAAIFTLAAFFAYRIRKNESAGSAVIFRPVRSVVKVMASVLIALAAAAVTVESLGGNPSRNLPAVLFIIVLSVVVVSGIMEIIYNYNFKAAFRRLPEMAVGFACSIVIYSFFAFDLAGINCYLPDASQLSRAALYPRYMGSSTLMDADGPTKKDSTAWYAERMDLPDKEAVLSLAKLGMTYTMSGDDWDQSRDGYDMVVVYTLKSGKQISRTFTLPETVDSGLMDRVVGSDSYKNTVYELDPGELTFSPKNWKVTADCSTILSDSPLVPLTADQLLRLREAYVQDLKQYDYSFAHSHYASCVLELNYEDPSYNDDTDWDLRHSGVLDLDVYPEYTETIALLKEFGIYQENVPAPAEVRSATLETYSEKGIEDMRSLGFSEEDMIRNSEDLSSGTRIQVKDPGLIKQLLERAVSISYAGQYHTQSQYLEATLYLTLASDTEVPASESFGEYDIPDPNGGLNTFDYQIVR